MKKTVCSLLLLVFFISLSGCAGRVPSAQRAHHLTQKYYKKYGKKYKASDFGEHRVERVEIVKVQELQKKIADIDAYVYLESGPVYWVRVTVQKKTFGWRVVSWETLGIQQK